MKQFQFTVHETELLVEALELRASRLESMARAEPSRAGPYERRAKAMRQLRARLLAKHPPEPDEPGVITLHFSSDRKSK